MTTLTVLTVGDLGRSPRMQYHAISAAQWLSSSPSKAKDVVEDPRVVLVGLEGKKCADAVYESPIIHVRCVEDDQGRS